MKRQCSGRVKNLYLYWSGVELEQVRGRELFLELHDLPRPIYGHRDSVANIFLDFDHSHSWVQFSTVLEGSLTVSLSDSVWRLPSRRGIIIPVNTVHRMIVSPGGCVKSLYLDPSLGLGIGGSCSTVSISPLMKELLDEFGSYPECYDEQGEQGRLSELIIDQLRVLSVVEHDLLHPVNPVLKELCSLAASDPKVCFDLEHACKTIGVGRKHLNRILRSETGVTFREWGRRVRLMRHLKLGIIRCLHLVCLFLSFLVLILIW